MNKQDSTSQQLLDMGFKEIQGQAKKYRVFERPEISRKLYIGRHGAIRYGDNLATSISVSPKLIVHLQQKFLINKET
jgi:hypothetical protein